MLFVAIGSAFGFAIVVRPLLQMRGRFGSTVAVIVASMILLCPLLIPPGWIVGRALAYLPCVDLWFKMLDYARLNREGRRVGGFSDYLRFLVPFPAFQVRFRNRDRRLQAVPSVRREIARIVASAAIVAFCFFLAISGAVGIRRSFLLDHLVKLPVFVITIESISQLLYGIERLAGFETRPLIRRMTLSLTVSDFWSRYNTRVHAWLIENVFRPFGGRRHPVRGVLATFFVSGIFHELAFGIATGRFDGFQFSFFMIQAPAVLMSPGLERFARRNGIVGNIAVRGFTVIWMAITSMLFFHGVNRVFPFVYASSR